MHVPFFQEAWNGFHIDKGYVSKFMKSILVGRVKGYHGEDCIGTQNTVSGNKLLVVPCWELPAQYSHTDLGG